MVLFRVNCSIPTLSKSKAVRGKYCIVLPGEGNEFELSTKDTLISRRVMYTSHELLIRFQCKGLFKGPYSLTIVLHYNARYNKTPESFLSTQQ